MSVLLHRPIARKELPWTLSSSRGFIWLYETSILRGNFFLQLRKDSYQFLCIHFSPYLMPNLLPECKKGGKKSPGWLQILEKEGSLSRLKRVRPTINVVERNQFLVRQTRLRTGRGGEESVICVCFSFKLNYAFLGQTRSKVFRESRTSCDILSPNRNRKFHWPLERA